MKRDWELVRHILLQMENAKHNEHIVADEGEDPNVFAYHCKMMADAGLIEAAVSQYLGGGMSAQAIRITWAGHEFLDSIRPKPVWEKVKTEAKEKGIDLTFTAIKALAEMAMKAAIGG